MPEFIQDAFLSSESASSLKDGHNEDPVKYNKRLAMQMKRDFLKEKKKEENLKAQKRWETRESAKR